MGKNNGHPDLVCEKSRSRGWDKEIPHSVLPMEQLVLSEKWLRKCLPMINARFLAFLDSSSIPFI